MRRKRLLQRSKADDGRRRRGPGVALTSCWIVDAPREAAFTALIDGSLPRWWSAVYLEARDVVAGGADGVGRSLDVVTRGRLPYRLRWRATIASAERPGTLTVTATGDLKGEGTWTLVEAHGQTVMSFLWHVRVTRPWMQIAMPVLRPVFAANHAWAMAQGEAGLRRYLASTAP